MADVTFFNTVNAQSDGTNKLKRIEFEFMGILYAFALNPEEFTQSEPARITPVQTKAGGWIDDFGAGIPTISIKGTTGFKNGTNNGTTGFAKFKELRDMIRKYYNKLPQGQPITTKDELIFHNYTDGEDWIVSPTTFDLYRSVTRSTMYLYTIQLVCIRPANEPSMNAVDVTDNVTSPDSLLALTNTGKDTTTTLTLPASGTTGTTQQPATPEDIPVTPGSPNQIPQG